MDGKQVRATETSRRVRVYIEKHDTQAKPRSSTKAAKNAPVKKRKKAIAEEEAEEFEVAAAPIKSNKPTTAKSSRKSTAKKPKLSRKLVKPIKPIIKPVKPSLKSTTAETIKPVKPNNMSTAAEPIESESQFFC